MNPRRLLVILVFGLPVLLVVLATIIGAYGIAAGVGDLMAAAVLWWIGMAILMVLAVNLILLVMLLGWQALDSQPRDPDEESPRLG